MEESEIPWRKAEHLHVTLEESVIQGRARVMAVDYEMVPNHMKHQNVGVKCSRPDTLGWCGSESGDKDSERFQ